jgi:BlaI family penicillinase repressor
MRNPGNVIFRTKRGFDPGRFGTEEDSAGVCGFGTELREKDFLACSPFLCVTVCNTMASNTHDPGELGELEREILTIVWRCGSATAEQAREELERPLKDSTVRTVLRRLEEKGYVAHSVEDRTFVYRPAESRQKVAGRAVKRIVDWFCDGSVEALLVGMVDSKVLDRAELQRLAARIAEAQKQAGKPKKEAGE